MFYITGGPRDFVPYIPTVISPPPPPPKRRHITTFKIERTYLLMYNLDRLSYAEAVVQYRHNLSSHAMVEQHSSYHQNISRSG